MIMYIILLLYYYYCIISGICFIVIIHYKLINIKLIIFYCGQAIARTIGAYPHIAYTLF